MILLSHGFYLGTSLKFCFPQRCMVDPSIQVQHSPFCMCLMIVDFWIWVSMALSTLGCHWIWVSNSLLVFTSHIPPECSQRLLEQVTKEEVKQAMMRMGSYKAPGSDGFQPFSFKHYQEVVGDDVWNLVRGTFDSGSMDPVLAEALIVLIPKVDQPRHLKDF